MLVHFPVLSLVFTRTVTRHHAIRTRVNLGTRHATHHTRTITIETVQFVVYDDVMVINWLVYDIAERFLPGLEHPRHREGFDDEKYTSIRIIVVMV